MIAINRENSKNLWSYKLLDSVNLKILMKQKITQENNLGIDLIYLVEYNNQLYIFGGNHKKSYMGYEGFMTSEQEISNYKNNLVDLLIEDIEFNNSIINQM